MFKIVSDRLFNVDSVKASKLHAKVAQSPVYDIYFSYKGDHSVTQDLYDNFKEILGRHLFLRINQTFYFVFLQE